MAALFQSWHGIFRCKGEVSPNYMLITFSKLQLILKWFSRVLNSHTFVCCLLYALCSFSYNSAYFLPKSWLGSCCMTKDVFILFWRSFEFSLAPAIRNTDSCIYILSAGKEQRQEQTLQLWFSNFIKGLPDLQGKGKYLRAIISDAATLMFIYGQITFWWDFFISFSCPFVYSLAWWGCAQ